MPTKRKRLGRSVREPRVDPMLVFTWCLDDEFTTVFNDRCGGFRSRADAERAWQEYRRAIWSREQRPRVPRPAVVFDGLTATAYDDLCYRWCYRTFEMQPTLAALAVDRANLERFAATKDGREIADYLQMVRDDLLAIEATARVWAESMTPSRARPFPHHVAGKCYGWTGGASLDQDNDGGRDGDAGITH